MVTEAEVVHDYVQLAFGDEIGISIYNEMEISPFSIRVDALIGKVVASVLELDNSIKIQFVDETQITIDMHRQAYRGPEALELYRQGLPVVVWN